MRTRLLVPLALALLLAGCAGLLKSGIGRPTVSLQEARVASLSFSAANLRFDFEIGNPNPIGLRLDGFEYALSVEGAPLLKGMQDAKVELPASGSNTVELPVSVRYQDLWNALRQVVQKPQAGYLLEAGFFFDLPALGRVRVPVRRDGVLPVLRLPTLRVERVHVAGLSARGADLRVSLQVENPNTVAANLERIESTLTLAGRPLGRIASDRPLQIAPNGTARIEIPLHLDLVQAGATVMRVLESGGVLDYALDGDLSLNGSGPEFVPAEVPFSGAGRTELVRSASAIR